MRAILGLFSYGGVVEGTVDSVLGELHYCSANKINMGYSRISGDALIERSRSRALGKFMSSDADVMVMIDHDITWRPGDVAHMANVAHKEKALVGGLYCKRAFKKGWSSRVPFNGTIQFGKPGLIETPALATGFLAIPRTVVAGIDAKLDITQPYWKQKFKEAVSAQDHAEINLLQDMSIAPIADGAYRQVEYEYKDYFRCIRYKSARPDVYQFLSEDWAFSLRAVYCGYKSYISTFPLLGHTGDHTYTVPDGMDDTDLEKLSGEKRNDGNTNNQDSGSGGNQVDVCNQCDNGSGNRAVPTRVIGKARRRRRR